MKTLRVRTADQWRDWLAQHHDSEAEVWLIFHKKHTGIASIAYADAVEEALCFGWVDSLLKPLDDRRYALKFTPRRADSRWSTRNRQRYAALKASGRLTPAGLNRPPTGRGYGPRPQRLALPSKLPAYMKAALKQNPAAFRQFKALSLPQRRRYFAWIESAKKEETKARRLEEAIRLLTAGKILGLK